MRRITGDITVEVVRGDITDQPDADAVVNAANAQLMPGGDVAGAIHRVAGPGLAEECRPLAPISPREAVITDAHDLPNRFVIHVLGPVYGRDFPEDRILSNCYRNALRLADENGCSSVAFPAVSTGIFGYPIRDAASIALSTVADVAHDLHNVRIVRFVLFSDGDLNVFEETLSSVIGIE